jgi:hypothetical protein
MVAQQPLVAAAEATALAMVAPAAARERFPEVAAEALAQALPRPAQAAEVADQKWSKPIRQAKSAALLLSWLVLPALPEQQEKVEDWEVLGREDRYQ